VERDFGQGVICLRTGVGLGRQGKEGPYPGGRGAWARVMCEALEGGLASCEV